MLLRAAAAALLLVAPGALAQQARTRSFLAGELIPAAGSTTHLLAADVDGDGRSDAIAVHGTLGEIGVHLSGSGEPLAGRVTHAVGLGPVATLDGDFDGDDALDLLVVESGSAAVSVLLNGGGGAFRPGQRTPVGLHPRAGGLADFDGDGRLDAVTSELISAVAGELTLLHGDGRGGLEAAFRLPIGDNAHALAVLDADADGSPDIAVAHTNTISLFRVDGRGELALGPRIRLEGIEVNPRALAAGDLDGDGRADLVSYNDTRDLITVLARADGSFEVRLIPTPRADLAAPALLGIVDFDGDGDLDAYTVATLVNRLGIGVVHGIGRGRFPPREEVYLGSLPQAVAFGDFEGDADLDLVAAPDDAPTLVIHRGRGAGALAAPRTLGLASAPRGLARLQLAGGGEPRIAALGSSELHLVAAGMDLRLAPLRSSTFPDAVLSELTAADLDADGADEAILADVAQGSIVIANLDAAGAVVATRRHDALQLPQHLAAADVDGDGRLDILVPDPLQRTLLVLRDPLAAAPPAPLRIDAGDGQLAVEADDLDRDGAVDLAVATRQGVSVLLGDGQGGLRPRRELSAVGVVLDLAAADLDRDGDRELVALADRRLLAVHEPLRDLEARVEGIEVPERGRTLVVASPAPDRTVLLIGLTSDILEVGVTTLGAPGEVEVLPAGALLRGLIAADFTGDGVQDCAVADYAMSAVVLLPGARRADDSRFRRGDANGDAVLNLTDPLVVLEALFRGGPRLACPDAADADDGGTIDIADAVILCTHLFRGGPAPAPPGPLCGADATADELGSCASGCR